MFFEAWNGKRRNEVKQNGQSRTTSCAVHWRKSGGSPMSEIRFFPELPAVAMGCVGNGSVLRYIKGFAFKNKKGEPETVGCGV